MRGLCEFLESEEFIDLLDKNFKRARKYIHNPSFEVPKIDSLHLNAQIL